MPAARRQRISYFAGADLATVDGVIAVVRQAADDGFDGIWLPQAVGVDALTALAVACREVPSIAVGTAVVPIQGRHPVPLAQQALTVADAAGPGRFTLGIGVSHPAVSEGRFGVPYKDVVALCEEELLALDGLLSAERRAEVAGAHVRTDATLTMTVERPGLVVAALGPRMLDLAGRLADGTVTWMTGPRGLRTRVVPPIHEAAAAAGRPEPRVIVGLPVCVTDDPDAARARVGAVLERMAAMPSYRRMLDAEGLDDAADLALIGSAEQVEERIVDLVAAGATEILADISGTPDEQLKTRAFLAGWAHA